MPGESIEPRLEDLKLLVFNDLYSFKAEQGVLGDWFRA